MTSLTRALSCKHDRDTGVLDDWFYLWHPTSLRRPADSGKGPQHGLHLGLSLQGPTKAVYGHDKQAPRPPRARLQNNEPFFRAKRASATCMSRPLFQNLSGAYPNNPVSFLESLIWQKSCARRGRAPSLIYWCTSYTINILPAVKFLMNISKPFIRDVRVYLSRCHILMSQKLLDASQVCAA